MPWSRHRESSTARPQHHRRGIIGGKRIAHVRCVQFPYAGSGAQMEARRDSAGPATIAPSAPKKRWSSPPFARGRVWPVLGIFTRRRYDCPFLAGIPITVDLVRILGGPASERRSCGNPGRRIPGGRGWRSVDSAWTASGKSARRPIRRVRLPTPDFRMYDGERPREIRSCVVDIAPRGLW